ncbi:MAG: hypothetical protein ABW215_04310 [Kibdelosporangium sp.]
MIERLREIFDVVDPAPDVVAEPNEVRERLAAFTDPVPMRDSGARLCFRKSGMTVDLELGNVLSGKITPAGSDVLVRWPDGVVWAGVDERGLFEVDVPRGPVQIVVGNAATDWFVW